MDGSRFDRLIVSFTMPGSRRRALGGLLAGTLGLLDSWAEEAAAKNCKKIQNKAKRKKCLAKTKGALPLPPSCPEGQRVCRGACLSVLICCDDTDCAGGRTCQQGTCACPVDKPHDDCPGSTICQQCCALRDCRTATTNDGQACQNGQCVCTITGTRRCPSGTKQAGLCGECCNDPECPEAQTCNTISIQPRCFCNPGRFCDDGGGHQVCVPDGCADKCFTRCNTPTTAPAGQPCCTGHGAWICTEVSPGDFQCVPPNQV